MTRALLILLVACRQVEPAQPGPDAAPPDATTDKSAACASTFGQSLTNAFGRLDGTILAVVFPGNQTCAAPNSTHVVLQVTMGGAAYRMVVNVMSTSPDPHAGKFTLDEECSNAFVALLWIDVREDNKQSGLECIRDP